MTPMNKTIAIIMVSLCLCLSLGITCRPVQAPVNLGGGEATPIATPTPAPPASPTVPPITIDPYEAELIAKTLYGEARGCSTTEQAAVVWCILSRVDATGYGMGRSVEHVITFPNQFLGYSANNPVLPELYDLAVDVLTRWEREKLGETDVGRVLPREFMWFAGDSRHNYFRDAYIYGQTWDWSLSSPYEDGMR